MKPSIKKKRAQKQAYGIPRKQYKALVSSGLDRLSKCYLIPELE